MRTTPILAVGILGFGLTLPLCVQAAEPELPFDKPVREAHMPLPKDPLNPQAKTELSCFYYPDMMVKQVDMGEVGAERLSVTPIARGAKAPPCVRGQAKNEIVFGHGEAWNGYYLGNKGGYLVLTAADSANGGSAFAVFNPAGDEIFEDDTVDITGLDLVAPGSASKARPVHDKLLRVRYTRTIVADCSVFESGAACWAKVQRTTGLTEPIPPACTKTYEQAMEHLPANQRQQLVTDPTVVSYPVEVTLDGKKVVVARKVVGKVTDCWPAE